MRQLADADEVLRVERTDSVNEIVANLRPFEADALIADVMAHPGRARRENGEIGAALALQLELVLLDALANFVVGHLQRCAQRHGHLVLGIGGCGLLLAEAMEVLGFGGVMAVAIDDHDLASLKNSWAARPAIAATGRRR